MSNGTPSILLAPIVTTTTMKFESRSGKYGGSVSKRLSEQQQQPKHLHTCIDVIETMYEIYKMK